MTGIIGYDPVRLPLLRSRLVEAIEGLGSIDSWCADADAALASVSVARHHLEVEHLRAIDEVIRSDAMERLGYGVHLVGGRGLRRLADKAAGLIRGSRGNDDRWEHWTDDELIDAVVGCIDGTSAPFPFDSFDVENFGQRVEELLRRLDGPSGDAMAAELRSRLDDARDQIGGFADSMAAEVGAARHGPVGGRRDLDPDTGIASLGQLLLRLAVDDPDFESWLLEEAPQSPTLTRIVLEHPAYRDDPQRIYELTLALIATRDDTPPDGLGRIDNTSAMLTVLAAHPDMSARLLTDADALDHLLRDRALDETAVSAALTAGLMLPAVQRRGEAKSQQQYEDELRDGLAVWERAIDIDSARDLGVGALRGLAGALTVYMPALSEAIDPRYLPGADSDDERDVIARVGDRWVQLGKYGNVAELFGYMASDAPAATALAIGHSSYTRTLFATGFDRVGGAGRVSTATLRQRIGQTVAPAVRFNRFVDHGIHKEQLAQDRRRQEGDSMRALGVDLLTDTLTAVVAGPTAGTGRAAWELAENLGAEIIGDTAGRLLGGDPETISRRIPLGFRSEFDAALLAALLQADYDERARLGLGGLDYETYIYMLSASTAIECDRLRGGRQLRLLLEDDSTSSTLLRELFVDVSHGAGVEETGTTRPADDAGHTGVED